MLIFFSFSFHVCCSLCSSKERQHKLKEGEDYTCVKKQWEMEGCVTSFLIVWFYFDFLNAMKILGVNLTYNTIDFNLYNFFKKSFIS